MIHLEWPWLLLALLLPFFARYCLPADVVAEQAALKVPFIEDFNLGETQAVSQNKQWPLLLAMLAWIFLVLACVRPQWLGDPIEQAISGRDLMLAVDLSRSMKEEDFIVEKQRVDRLTATKHIAGQFINRRQGDRLGLILFGTNAYLQTPLTFDRTTVITLLQESTIGLAGNETAIGDAIGLAVKRLRKQQANSRILILLTDGANTAGKVTPLKAAELAAANGLKIYTIGIGADEMIVRSFFGSRKINPSRHLDEKTLTAIAEKTGGRYFRAKNTQELEAIYQLLDALEPVEKDKKYFRPKIELYFWPLAFALLLAFFVSASRMNWKWKYK
ncbi:MAG: VWA domain-containing protein [Methylococcales symbiont of Iophon sp. n. MRB-2018]|nr:MAG: VWA domain-containing protein [Methylococcales symbiont of Iophon sp. n. MRB-2018]KAF3979023.1 MAG: VWA domain-containing protein [Methylococcales symbiont of Iophon sp. n. MRB-2018]